MIRYLICFLSFYIPLNAYALSSDWVRADYIQARVIVGEKVKDTITVGLELKLDENWYTYWRNPGDAGLPLNVMWENSENIKDITLNWPYPTRYDTFDMNSFGYDQSVVSPLDIVLKDPGISTDLVLKIDAMVCYKICVPQNLELNLTIPENASPQHKNLVVIDQAWKKVPVTDDTPNLTMETAVLGKDTLVFTAFSKKGFETFDLFLETPDNILTLPPVIEIDASDPTQAVLKIPAPEGMEDLTSELFGQTITATLVVNGKAIEKEFTF